MTTLVPNFKRDKPGEPASLEEFAADMFDFVHATLGRLLEEMEKMAGGLDRLTLDVEDLRRRVDKQEQS